MDPATRVGRVSKNSAGALVPYHMPSPLSISNLDQPSPTLSKSHSFSSLLIIFADVADICLSSVYMSKALYSTFEPALTSSHSLRPRTQQPHSPYPSEPLRRTAGLDIGTGIARLKHCTRRARTVPTYRIVCLCVPAASGVAVSSVAACVTTASRRRSPPVSSWTRNRMSVGSATCLADLMAASLGSSSLSLFPSLVYYMFT
ncbi:hypothetical protein BD414DRAFT_280265 [Trametes punicea]|nr:hypothetical protein BD414DRAFT_280265 [Trametes punicea]